MRREALQGCVTHALVVEKVVDCLVYSFSLIRRELAVKVETRLNASKNQVAQLLSSVSLTPLVGGGWRPGSLRLLGVRH